MVDTRQETHPSVPYSQRLTRTRDGSFFGGSTAAQRHDGNGDRYQAQDHRASEHPPLLRRYRGHGHNKVHNQQGQDPHDHTHHKSPRSAFARSRYRRESVHLGRRSSVYVPGEHGKTYLVSRTPPRNSEQGRTDTDKRSTHVFNRRQLDEGNLIMGRIDIMGTFQSPGSTQRLASLSVDPTPIDWTSGQNSAKAFPLNASTTNQTQFIMIPMDESSYTAGNSSKHVTLATEVFDAGSADMVMYCATYDPDPAATSALLMTPCTGAIQSASSAPDPCADDGNDASSSNPQESQIFSYDPSSGQIEPISTTTSSSGAGNDSTDLTSCTDARVRRDNSNSTTSGSVTPSSTSTSTAPTNSASQQARNVTLVYVAAVPEVPAPSPSSSNTTNTTQASIGQAAALTTTITTTVVVATTASESSSRTVTPAQAAVSVSVSSIPSQSTTTAAPSAFTTATTTRPSLSLLSSVSTTTTSRAPGNADESLEVEIVGIVPSTTSSSSTTTTTTTTTTANPYSSPAVSTTLDAQAIASSIAKEMVSRRAPVFASVTLTR
ncbi:hypothetical protein J3R82DRAFT_2614 [Butyriboletus roseoflavus]|nr:hypothetical protein J3R82DRAFT_2614 [Butyriboletus roseoflavus]